MDRRTDRRGRIREEMVASLVKKVFQVSLLITGDSVVQIVVIIFLAIFDRLKERHKFSNLNLD